MRPANIPLWACALGAALSGPLPALGQLYSAEVDCGAAGAQVTLRLEGYWGNTCPPGNPILTIQGNRIELQLDGTEPGFCGDTSVAWCQRATTPPLPDGVYQVVTTILPFGPVQQPDLVIDCSSRPRCNRRPLSGNPDGVNGLVRAMLTWDADGPGPQPELLIVGGDFDTAGGVAVNSIAAWDGHQWHALGIGLGGSASGGSSAYALLIHNGMLVVGGRFVTAGGAPAANIAMWDGANWLPLGAGIDGTVFALAQHDGTIVAGGYFPGTSGNIRRWNGQWEPIGFTDQPALVLFSFQGTLLAAGNSVLQRWDENGGGGAWIPLDTQFPGFANSVTAMIEHRGELFVATNLCWGSCSGGVLRWDGAHFNEFTSGIYGRGVQALCVHNDTLFAAANSLFACPGGEVLHLDGSQWASVGDTDGNLFALSSFLGELVAGGSFTRFGVTPTANIARWACENCRADFDNSGSVGVQDVFDFLTAYFSNDLRADLNGSGAISVEDIFDYLTAYFAHYAEDCP